VASYLIISAAFDDFVPEVNITIPRKLTHFIDEVTDGAVTDASLKSAKDWLDSTGQCPHYINPVHVVMSSKFNLSLDLMSTYRWRTKLTASASDRTRLCASSNGKSKTSRLKDMLPTVARFILAQGPDKMWAELVAAREADTQSSDRSPTNKAAVKRKLRLKQKDNVIKRLSLGQERFKTKSEKATIALADLKKTHKVERDQMQVAYEGNMTKAKQEYEKNITTIENRHKREIDKIDKKLTKKNRKLAKLKEQKKGRRRKKRAGKITTKLTHRPRQTTRTALRRR